MEFNKQQKERLVLLESLWKLIDSKLKIFDFQSDDLKYLLLFHIMGAAHRLIRGFIAQLKGRSNDDLESKLRTLVEAIINLNYILADDTDSRAKAFILNGSCSQLAAVERILELMKKDKAPAMSEITSIEKYEVTKGKLKKEISDIENANPSSDLRWPKISTRASLGNGDQTYATGFWLFSEDDHLTAVSLNRFMKDSEDGKVFMTTEMDLSRLDIEIQTAFMSYISILNTCTDKLGFPLEGDLDIFNESAMLPTSKDSES